MNVLDAPVPSTSAFSCGRCGCRIEPAVFRDLRRIRTLAREDLAAHVVKWPEDVVVDVRACARCTSPVARLVRILD
jgi:hypothetical protein